MGPRDNGPARRRAFPPASRVRHTNFPKATGPGIHVTGRRIGREFHLEFPQRLFETEPHDALREDMRLDKGCRRRFCSLRHSSMLHCSMLCQGARWPSTGSASHGRPAFETPD